MPTSRWDAKRPANKQALLVPDRPAGGFGMGEDRLEWTSFWDLASPEEVARRLIGLYGSAAAGAAVYCVVTAQSDGRHEDCSFWTAVFASITRPDRRPSKGTGS